MEPFLSASNHLSRVNRTVAVTLLAVLTVSAGCSGLSVVDGTSDGGSDVPVAGTATPGEPPLAEDHPYVTEGRLNASALRRAHHEWMERVDSLAVTNNRTSTYVENGSAISAHVTVGQFDLGDERLRMRDQLLASNGSVGTHLGWFNSETRDCTFADGESSCVEGGFDRGYAYDLATSGTTLGALSAPAFSPDGTTVRGGQRVYRYSATSFRSSVDDSALLPLGPDPRLRNATLLVAPGGRVVEYRVRLYGDGEGPEILRVHRYGTSGVNETDVESPSWVPS